jgi:KEOPS complex subunit Pcc1
VTHAAIFRFETEETSIICQAVKPEEKDENSGRTQSVCRKISDNTFEISITASDLSALRAALNTWLRLIQVASEMIGRTQI